MSLNASLMSVLAMNALGECCCTSLIASGIRHRGSPPAIYTVSLSVSDSVCLSLVLGHLKTGCLLLHMWHVCLYGQADRVQTALGLWKATQ